MKVIYEERAIGMAERGDLEAVAQLAAQSPQNTMPIDPATARALADAVRLRSPERARRTCHNPAAATNGIQGLSVFCIVALSRLGDLNSAFAIAFATYPDMRASTAAGRERLWLDHPVDMPIGLLASPALAAMRRDPRFLILAARVGLLDYWRGGRLPDFCRGEPEPICRALTARA